MSNTPARLVDQPGSATGGARSRSCTARRTGLSRCPRPICPCCYHDDVEFLPTGESPLRLHEGFLRTTCPICGGPATREDRHDGYLRRFVVVLPALLCTMGQRPTGRRRSSSSFMRSIQTWLHHPCIHLLSLGRRFQPGHSVTLALPRGRSATIRRSCHQGMNSFRWRAMSKSPQRHHRTILLRPFVRRRAAAVPLFAGPPVTTSTGVPRPTGSSKAALVSTPSLATRDQ